MSLWSTVCDGYDVICPKCHTTFELEYKPGSFMVECPGCDQTGSWSEEFTEENNSMLIFGWD